MILFHDFIRMYTEKHVHIQTTIYLIQCLYINIIHYLAIAGRYNNFVIW
jgi:hypothetical protein